MSYAKDVLVETDWVAEHLDDDSIRFVEADENPALYEQGHIPGAVSSTGTSTSRTRSSATSSTPEASTR